MKQDAATKKRVLPKLKGQIFRPYYSVKATKSEASLNSDENDCQTGMQRTFIEDDEVLGL